MFRFAAANLASKARCAIAKRGFANAASSYTTCRGAGIIKSNLQENLPAKVSSRLGWTRNYMSRDENNYEMKTAATNGGTYYSTSHTNLETERQKLNEFHASLGKETCLLEDPLVLILDKKLSSENAVMKVLTFGYEMQKPLLVIAKDLGSKAYWTFRMKTREHPLSICATIKAPEFGRDRIPFLQNLAQLTGGQVVTEELGIRFDENNLCMKVLGSCKKVQVYKEIDFGQNIHKSTILIEGGCKQSAFRSSTLDFEEEKLPEKLAICSAFVHYPALGKYTAEDMKYMNGYERLDEFPSEEFTTMQTSENVPERNVPSIADRAKFCKSNGECNCEIDDYYFDNDVYKYHV